MAIRGLTVGSDATLRLDGHRFRNIGVNWGGAIVRIFNQPSPTVCEYTPASEQDAGLDYLASLGVRVIRVKAFPYWPAQWTVGVLNNKAWNVATAVDRELHYAKIDAFLGKCRSRGIGVILNLFFRHANIPDLVGSNVRGWLSAGNVRTFATTITNEIVGRYLNEESVYGWEFSNELNHYNDYTGAGFPNVQTSYGTQASYPVASNIFNGTELQSVLAWWYGVVRAIDSQRIVMSGNGPCSYSRPGGSAGTAAPVLELFKEIDRDNPLNTSSMHFYGGIGYCSLNFTGLGALLTGGRHWARNQGRAFIVGEVGNQPRKVSSVSGGVVTLDASSDLLNSVAGDAIELVSAGAWSGRHTVLSVATDRRSLVVKDVGAVSFSGLARLVDQTEDRVTRILNDAILSDVDLLMWWQYDTDPLTPVAESIAQGGGVDWQALAIMNANSSLL